jgi:hypothetical protein
MATRQDGGPAFPVIGAPGAPEDYGGMSLRDYFAAQALAGSADTVCDVLSDGSLGDSAEHCARHARACYALADAMLKAREV